MKSKKQISLIMLLFAAFLGSCILVLSVLFWETGHKQEETAAPNTQTKTATATVQINGIHLTVTTDEVFEWQETAQAPVRLVSFYGTVSWGRTQDASTSPESIWISGGGTASPIKYSADSLYIAGNHFVAGYRVKHTPDGADFYLAEYANETFDDEGNVTYSYYNEADGDKEGIGRVVKDASYLIYMSRLYENANVLTFDFK